jgi:hypothetical protein
MSLSTDEIRRLNKMGPVPGRVQLGTLLSQVEARLNANYRLTIPLPGTLGADVGADGDGVLFGDLTHKDPGDATYDGVVAQYDASGTPKVTDYTTEAAEATQNDVLPFPTSPAATDYAAFAAAVKFIGLLIKIGTQANMSATTAWKYSGPAGALTALTPLFDATSGLLVAATGWKLMHFPPPSDWTAVALADTVTGERYMVVCEIATLSSSTTEPLIDQVKFIHAVGDGIDAKIAGTVNKLIFNFNTVSGSTANSAFLLLNVTQGTWQTYTKTKATAYEEVEADLAVTAGDELVLCQVTEDGSTEFADGSVHIEIDPTEV